MTEAFDSRLKAIEERLAHLEKNLNTSLPKPAPLFPSYYSNQTPNPLLQINNHSPILN